MKNSVMQGVKSSVRNQDGDDFGDKLPKSAQGSEKVVNPLDLSTNDPELDK